MKNSRFSKKDRMIDKIKNPDLIVDAIKESEAVVQAKETLKNERVQYVISWAFSIAAAILFGVLLSLTMFQSVTMQESAMEPTISIGDRFFIDKLKYKLSSPKQGDIIVYRANGSDDAALHISRVIGLPGDTVQITDGYITINGEIYKEGKDFPTINNAGLAANGVTLGEDEYFVLGDNRNNSEDSRFGEIGNVQKKYIVGKLWFTISPKSKIGPLDN